MDDQLAEVADQLAGILELQDGFDALGFSQGRFKGEFSVSRCNVQQVDNSFAHM